MTTSHKRKIENLRREIGRISAWQRDYQDCTQVKDFRSFDPAPPDTRLQHVPVVSSPEDRGPFCYWLVQQTLRDDLVGQLARAGQSDRSFPLNGSVEDLRARLRACTADADMFEALDEAELDWLSH